MAYQLSAWMIAVLIILVTWSMVWKAFALWRSARNKQTAWYVVMFIINTAGILEIIYLFFFAKPKG